MNTHSYYKGWMFVGLSKDFPVGKIISKTLMHEECLLFRGESGQLNMTEAFCSHFGVNMATGKIIRDCIQCPMHGRMFNGDGTGQNAKHRSIRSYPISENRGLAFAYFDQEGLEPEWDAPGFLSEETCPDILWRHSRELSLHHFSVPMDNAVDPRHFEFTHSMFGKHIVDGEFKPEGHKALGTMSTEITPPLSYVTSNESKVITQFDGPLNTCLQADIGGRTSDLCNFLTIIEGNKCLLTQVGIGCKSLNPLKWLENAVGYAGSWYATYEDAPVWNNRKVQEPDSYPHQTDKTLEEFRVWFDTFKFDPNDANRSERPLKVVAKH